MRIEAHDVVTTDAEAAERLAADRAQPSVYIDGGIFYGVQDVEGCLGGKRWCYVYDRQLFHTWWTHADEHAVRELFWGHGEVKPGDVVLDIGAAYGSYILPALACGAGHVYAWTPDDGAPQLILRSLIANGWRGRCSIIPSGLWDRDGWLVAKSGPEPSSFYAPLDAHPREAFPVTTLDAMSIGLGLSRVDWIKVDVEGAECEVLRGGLKTIARFQPKLLIEAHLFKDAEMEKRIAEILEPIGYQAIETLALEEIVETKYGLHVSHTLWRPR